MNLENYTAIIPDKYFDYLFPTIVMPRKINKSSTIRLGFYRRINRPDYEKLNPYVLAIDHKNLTTGNPALEPEVGNRIEVGYLREFKNNSSLNLTAFTETAPLTCL